MAPVRVKTPRPSGSWVVATRQTSRDKKTTATVTKASKGDANLRRVRAEWASPAANAVNRADAQANQSAAGMGAATFAIQADPHEIAVSMGYPGGWARGHPDFRHVAPRAKNWPASASCTVWAAVGK